MAAPKQRTVETISVSEARQKLSETLNHVREDNARYIVEKSGIPVAAVVPMEDIERLQQLDTVRAERLADLRKAIEVTREELADISPDEIEREIEKAISEVRASRRERSLRSTDSFR